MSSSLSPNRPNDFLDFEQMRLRIQRKGIGSVDHAIIQSVSRSCFYDIPLAKLAELISQSPALAALICRAASTIEYSPTPVKSVLYALELLEPKKIREICLTTSFYCDEVSNPTYFKTCKIISRHCLAMGVFTRNLARLKKTIDPEAAFTCGLFCDSGYVALARFNPDALEKVMSTIFNTPNIAPEDVESYLLGYNHAQVGHAVAQEFGLTNEVQEAILHHLAPSYCPTNSIELADLCHLSAWILDRMGFPALPTSPELKLDPFILKRLKLTIDQMQTILKVSQDELTELLRAQAQFRAMQTQSP